MGLAAELAPRLLELEAPAHERRLIDLSARRDERISATRRPGATVKA